jgi:hypothetical protein
MLQAFRRRHEPLTDPEAEPAPPRAANPFEEAIRHWNELKSFAERMAHQAAGTAAENRQLLADNDALGREVDRLLHLLNEALRDNRLIRAYATALRTRLTILRENAEQADRESLEYARHAVDPPTQPEPPAEETAALAEVVEGIHRVGTAPPVNEWAK